MGNKVTTFKFKPILGSLPEMGATDWWTKEQWDEHNKYVEKLKAEGKYLTEGEEMTFTIQGSDAFDTVEDDEPKFRNFGIIIPK